MTVIIVTGSGRERGLAHGEQLRDRIHQVLARVVDDLGGPGAVEHFIASTSFAGAIEQHTPDLYEELLGIADGAGVPRSHLLAHNLMDEHWWWSQVGRAREACSTLAVASPPLVGQTMDLDRLLDGSQVIVRIMAADGQVSAVLTSAGMVGLCGASSAGFGICVNALTTLEHSGSGLPVAFVMRGALAQPTAGAAAEFIRSVPHASGQHYAIVGRDASGRVSTTSLECSAFGTIPAAPTGSGFGHANHPLATTDVDPEMAATESRSELRQSVLDAALGTVTSLDDLTDLLTAQPLCVPRTDSDWFTFGAIAVALDAPVAPEQRDAAVTPDQRDPAVTPGEQGSAVTMRYTLGPPDAEPWQSLTLP